jgi:hypothetical protein
LRHRNNAARVSKRLVPRGINRLRA